MGGGASVTVTPLSIQVHYASFQVDFLNFEEEEADQSSQDEGVASIEDDEAIEGCVVLQCVPISVY